MEGFRFNRNGGGIDTDGQDLDPLLCAVSIRFHHRLIVKLTHLVRVKWVW